MTVKRIVCLLTLCCVLLLPLTATAQPVQNETLRMTLGGDVDGDGALTSTDARLVLTHATRSRFDFSMTPDVADLNGDGEITPTDARILLQYYGGQIHDLSAPSQREGGALPGDFFSFSEPTLDVSNNIWSITLYMHPTAPLLDGMLFISYPVERMELIGQEVTDTGVPCNFLTSLPTVDVNPQWAMGLIALGFCDYKQSLVGEVAAITLQFRPKHWEGGSCSLSLWAEELLIQDGSDPAKAIRYTGGRNSVEWELPTVSLTPPTKTEYPLGITELDLTGGQLHYTWQDGRVESQALTHEMITFPTFDGNRLGEHGMYIVDTVVLTVYVVPPTVTAIALESPPEALFYSEERLWTVAGGGLAVSYNNDTAETIPLTADMLAIPKDFQPGTQTVTLTYEGQTVTFEATVLATPKGKIGDVDLDGSLTSTDARLVLQYVVKKATVSDLAVPLADMDCDSVITTTDARLILQYAVDKDPFWPFPPPLLYQELDAPLKGEPVPFVVGETVDSRKGSHLYEDRANSIHLIQSKEQWDYIRTRYGFTKTYDAAFFAEHALVFMDVMIYHYTSEFALEQIAQNGPALEIHYRIYSDEPYALPACYNTTTVAEIPKAVADDITRLSVYVSN